MSKVKKKLPVGITRFDPRKTSFNGFRIAKSRHGYRFSLYQSVATYGNVKKTLAATEDTLRELNAKLDEVKSFRGKRLSKAARSYIENTMRFSVKNPPEEKA